MINKIFSIIGFGVIFAIFPICLFYGGIYTNYFTYYGIREYFNSFFMQNLNLIFYGIFSLFTGFAFTANGNFLKYLYLIFALILSLSFIPKVGVKVGEKIFLKENAKMVINGETQRIRIIYKDKYKLYYNTKKEPKIIMVPLNANR
ncbi:hypothetical protein [Helicobacter sp. MIT 14-3879]|uniref:hypothetical protein n=1 Tax=Helicobacter sp. MIT 14-3879 TaxID=2040649 RepID=UPI000E1EE880|nr:hypothetical protein [Helicobacter sp. MIT 14-3879]RDU65427.1 hypothetical protein CQA44_00080 [Helicobacter sp. MIT 14-3879]